METREYYQCDRLEWMQKKLLERDKQYRDDMQDNEASREQITEKRYYISSLPLNIELFARIIREHWSLVSRNYALAFGCNF